MPSNGCLWDRTGVEPHFRQWVPSPELRTGGTVRPLPRPLDHLPAVPLSVRHWLWVHLCRCSGTSRCHDSYFVTSSPFTLSVAVYATMFTMYALAGKSIVDLLLLAVEVIAKLACDSKKEFSEVEVEDEEEPAKKKASSRPHSATTSSTKLRPPVVSRHQSRIELFQQENLALILGAANRSGPQGPAVLQLLRGESSQANPLCTSRGTPTINEVPPPPPGHPPPPPPQRSPASSTVAMHLHNTGLLAQPPPPPPPPLLRDHFRKPAASKHSSRRRGRREDDL